MKKRIFWLMLVAVLLPVLPSVAQSESYVALSGNAYITAAPENVNDGQKAAFIDEYHCTLRNWNSAETVVSYYFRTETIGKMNIALQAKGHSQIEVSLLGKKKKNKAR